MLRTISHSPPCPRRTPRIASGRATPKFSLNSPLLEEVQITCRLSVWQYSKILGQSWQSACARYGAHLGGEHGRFTISLRSRLKLAPDFFLFLLIHVPMQY